MRNIQKRLERIENQLPPTPPTSQERLADYFDVFFMVSIAYHLGNPGQNDSVLSAYARALGYENLPDYMAISPEDNDEASKDLVAKRCAAQRQLYAKFGVSPKDKWETFLERI